MVTETLDSKLLVILENRFPELEIRKSASSLVLIVPANELIAVMQELHDSPRLDFDLLSNLTSVDYPDMYCVVYNLVSLKHGFILEVRVHTGKDLPEVPSVIDIWGAADWQEREVYDLMGIVFKGHPNLTRILLGDDFKGYPLRKDFEYTGGR